MAGRKSSPGIDYYYEAADIVVSDSIKLLLLKHGADGFWAYKCLLYRVCVDKGYYFDMNEAEYFELFCFDTIKLTAEKVMSIIESCIKYKLFDGTLFNQYKILTSKDIQENYAKATKDRRRHGTQVNMYQIGRASCRERV